MLSARAPNAGYVEVATRTGMAGAVDKLLLVEELANHHRLDRRVQALALQICQGVGSGSDAQVKAIEDFCTKLPYRREPYDILREPLQVAQLGGDCDDLTLLCLSLLRALSIPCEPQLFCDPAEGEAFHIRAIAYLPPGRPQWAYTIDPVFWSERQWHLESQNGKPNLPAAQMMPAAQAVQQPGRLQGTSEPAPASKVWPLLGWLAGIGALWHWSRPRKRSKNR